jgi:phosphoribosylaminoimidazole-succinocarboxamide synthase
MGSVKDPVVLQKPTEEELGTGLFVFSDRYSVFDWGEMPDLIPDKGKAICLATAHFFEKLEESGISSHYLGVMEDGVAKRVNQLNSASDTFKVKFVRVIEPQLSGDSYDYSVFRELHGNHLIPLEVIFRNSLPAGSSVFKRLKDGSLKLEDIGLSAMPSPGEVLEMPLLDVSTKLESTDRYITWEEARTIANLSVDELQEMKRITSLVNGLISAEAGKLGLFHEDGKIEFGFDENRNLMIVDALGTLDECRFTSQGLPVSKELARIYYRDSDWHKETSEAKKQSQSQWRELVQSSPDPLPPEFLSLISAIYGNYTNEITGRRFFDVPSMGEVLTGIRSYNDV